MNVIRASRFVRAMVCVALAMVETADGQQPATPPPTPVARITVEPSTLTLVAGQTGQFKISAYDAQGNEIANPHLRASGPRSALSIGPGEIHGILAGDYEVVCWHGPFTITVGDGPNGTLTHAYGPAVESVQKVTVPPKGRVTADFVLDPPR